MRKCVGCRIFVFLVVVAGAGWLPGTAPIRTAASAPPEFDIAVIPAAQAVAPGEAITYTVALTATSGFSEPVMLSVTGLPGGAVHAFGETPVTPTIATALVITPALHTPAGHYLLHVEGASNSLHREAALTLTVGSRLCLPLALESHELLSADFEVAPAPLMQGVPAHFHDRSTGFPTTWHWDFGDGSPITITQHPTHTFAASGYYTVTLTVANPYGMAAAAAVIEVVEAGEPPRNLVANGGFEDDRAWLFSSTPAPAGYTTAAAHAGLRSLRLGIVPPAVDRYSYSSAYQSIFLPYTTTEASLTFWYLPKYEGVLSAAVAPLAADPVGQTLEDWRATLAGDAQYAMVLNSNLQVLEVLLATHEDAAGWQEAVFDLTGYAGQTLYIYFDVYNDGDGARTWMFVDDVAVTATGNGGGDPGAKWIDVDLSEQTLYAYEGTTIVNSSLCSTGLPATPTPVGQFHVYIKLLYDDMAGPGYYLPDVPYVMYFYLGYGIHGTYWHDNFGHPMSHGCINLPTPFAGWLYAWSPLGILVNIHP